VPFPPECGGTIIESLSATSHGSEGDLLEPVSPTLRIHARQPTKTVNYFTHCGSASHRQQCGIVCWV